MGEVGGGRRIGGGGRYGGGKGRREVRASLSPERES